MGVRRPDWWCYPERCQNGPEWGPGLITVSWVLCDCPPAMAARDRAGGGLAGHMAGFCNAAPRCRSVWYRPAHEPRQVTKTGFPAVTDYDGHALAGNVGRLVGRVGHS